MTTLQPAEHTKATLTRRVRRSPASLGGCHYHLDAGQAVRILLIQDGQARCYVGEPAARRISEDYFWVRMDGLAIGE